MKVLFLYVNSTKSWDMPMGIGYLSAALKTSGYETGLLDMTWPMTPKQILKEMKGYDVLAVSSTTLEYQLSLNIAMLWKDHFGLPVIFGGYKATLEPEELYTNPFVDAVCMGEGEDALVEWIQEYEARRSVKDGTNAHWGIANFYPNPLRALRQDLDNLAFPDRSIFDKRHIEMAYPGTAILTSRGCPFNCSMCVNQYLKKLYGGLGPYTRFRSVQNILEEIEEVMSRYEVQRFFFIDDTFTINHSRLEEFCERYGREIGIPFLIMGRCNTVTKNLIQKLRDAGCVYIGFGVESGNTKIRNEVLNRDMSEKSILDAFRWSREAGIKTASYNMIGVPFETREAIFDTIKLNKKAKPDVIQTTMLYPFPKTEILEVAKQNKLLLLNTPGNSQSEYYTQSIIKIEGFTPRTLYGLEIVIPLYVHLPKVLWPFIRVVEFGVSRFPKLRWFIQVFRKKVLRRKFQKAMS